MGSFKKPIYRVRVFEFAFPLSTFVISSSSIPHTRFCVYQQSTTFFLSSTSKPFTLSTSTRSRIIPTISSPFEHRNPSFKHRNRNRRLSYNKQPCHNHCQRRFLDEAKAQVRCPRYGCYGPWSWSRIPRYVNDMTWKLRFGRTKNHHHKEKTRAGSSFVSYLHLQRGVA